MSISDAVKPVLEVEPSELSPNAAAAFTVISFGTPGAESENKIELAMQAKDLHGNDLAAQEIVRLTCGGDATMSLGSGARGTVLSGDDSNDMIVQTDEDGAFDLEVTDATSETSTILAGPTQGSGLMDCSASVECDFSLV